MPKANGKQCNMYTYMDDVLRTAIATDLNEYCLGLAGEVGEVLELIKKHRYQKKQLDVCHLKEEMGDALFYLCALMIYYNVDIGDCIDFNVKKRAKKYSKHLYKVKR
jgi:NTP pyrophosphatase (non-canonical NTP hydrolase)